MLCSPSRSNPEFRAYVNQLIQSKSCSLIVIRLRYRKGAGCLNSSDWSCFSEWAPAWHQTSLEVVIAISAHNGPGLAARVAGAGPSGASPVRSADPQLAAAEPAVGVGNRPIRAEGISQVNLLIHHPCWRHFPVQASLRASK